MTSINNFKVLNDYLPYQSHLPLQNVEYNGKSYQLYEVEVNPSLPEKFWEIINGNEPLNDVKKINAIFVNPSYSKKEIIDRVANDLLVKEDWREISRDRDVVLTAIQAGIYDWSKGDLNFRKDREIILEAIHVSISVSDRNILQYAHEDLKKDKAFILTVVAKDGLALEFAHPNLRKDREVVLASIKSTAKSFIYAHEDLRKDKEFVLEAVAQNGFALEFVQEDLKKDKDVVLEAIAQNGKAFKFAHESLKQDKEFVLKAVAQNGFALEFVQEDLKKDKDVVWIATEKAYAFEHAHEDFKNNREFMVEAIKRSKFAFKFAHEDLKKDKTFILEFAKHNPSALRFVHKDLKNNREFALQLIEQNFESFFYLSEDLKRDPYLVEFCNVKMLDKLRSLKEDYSQRQKLITFTRRVINQQQILFLHDEHPLMQEALQAHFVAAEENNPKNPYKLYNVLQSTIKQEPLSDDFVNFRNRAAKLKNYTFADIPKNIIPPLALFNSMEARGIDNAQVAALCNNAMFEEVKENITGEDRIVPTILAKEGSKEDFLDLTAMHLYLILEQIAKEDDARKDGKLSDRETMLLKFASMIKECHTGQADAIDQYYIYTLNPVASGSGKAKIEETIDNAVQVALNKALASDHFLSELTGIEDVKQQSHQTLYIKNRYHKQIGLKHTLNFDFHTGVVYDSLIEQDPRNIIRGIKKHLRHQDEIKSALDRAIKSPKGIGYMEFVQYFEESFRIDIEYDKYFEFDEELNPLGLTPFAIDQIIKHLGYVT